MNSTRRQAIHYLRMLKESGVIALPAASVAAEPEPAEVVDIPAPNSEAQLNELADEIAACKKCRLCDSRNNTVPGEGNPNADIVFVGEAPGGEEDRTGRPFVGRAGELLTKMIQAMKFDREDVFICNVIKCRPPGNRNPENDEIASCEPYLLKQLDILQPAVIVTLGKFAAHCLLDEKTPITRLRGAWREYHGIPLMPTFHPSYLLRSPGEKRKAWEDLQKVMAEYERVVGPLPSK